MDIEQYIRQSTRNHGYVTGPLPAMPTPREVLAAERANAAAVLGGATVNGVKLGEAGITEDYLDRIIAHYDILIDSIDNTPQPKNP